MNQFSVLARNILPALLFLVAVTDARDLLAASAVNGSGMLDGGPVDVAALSQGVLEAAYGGNHIGDGFSPIITNQPEKILKVAEDVSATLSIGVTGQAPLFYQWWHESNTVAGATDAALTFPGIKKSEAGLYFCVVSNTFGVVTSLVAEVTVVSLPSGIARPVIVGVSVPVGSSDMGSVASSANVWEVHVPPYPFNMNSGIGYILNASGTPYFCLHDHMYTSPFVPYAERAMVTYEFNQPAAVGYMQFVLHANGIVQIEGFAGDTPETLESVGVVTGSKGIPPTVYGVFSELSINTFSFPNPRPGKLFVMVVRRTSWVNGYANYQTYLYAPDGRQYLPAATPAQVVPLITIPRTTGTIQEGDRLFFSARETSDTVGARYHWRLDAAEMSLERQPGYILFPTSGTFEISCDLLDEQGEIVDAERYSLSVVPDDGRAPDLSVSSVDAPMSLKLGATATLNYTVTNCGPGAVAATNWIDAVYLSSDELLDSSDVLVGSAIMNGPLAVGETYANTLELALPIIDDGEYHVIVSIDDAWQVLEVHQLNNERATPVAVGAANLAMDAWVDAQVRKADSYQFYRVDVSNAHPVVIEVQFADGFGHARLYARHANLPSLSEFDFASSGGYGASPSLSIPLASQGTWYILVHAAQEVGAGAYSIRVRPVELEITRVSPTRCASDQKLTLDVAGIGFTSSDALSLVHSDGAVYHPDSLELVDPEQLVASFVSGSLPPGVYAVKVERSDGIATLLPAAVTVAATGRPVFSAKLITPAELGRNATGTIFLEYSNTGDVSMSAPILVLSASQGAKLSAKSELSTADYWTTATPRDASDTQQFLAAGQTPGVLHPGETVRVPVRYLGLTHGGDPGASVIRFSLGTLDASSGTADQPAALRPIDWGTLMPGMRPPSIPADAWEALWPNFTSAAGATWDSYQQMLVDNADYLARLGYENLFSPLNLNALYVSEYSPQVSSQHVGDLLAFEFAQADGLHVVRHLASSTDGFAPTPGLRLSLERVFPNRITSRYRLGSLGRGWSHNWELWRETAADGTVAIVGPGESRRTFKPDVRGGYSRDPGDYATLTALGGGVFTLREKNGLLRVFRADGKLDYVQDLNAVRITCAYEGDALISLTHSAGQALIMTYSGGRVATVNDDAGRQTVLAYSGEHLVSARYFDGSEVRYAYSLGQGLAREHALTEIAHPGGTHEFFAYDTRGRLTGMSREGGAEAVTFGFDSAGQVTATDALGNSSRFFFDCHGLLAKTVNPLGNAVRLNYDNQYNLVAVTDPAGRSHDYTYDTAGNLVAATDALGFHTRFAYAGPYSRLSQLTDANGNSTRYSYDERGNLAAITYADNRSETWVTDASGQPTEWVNRRGHPVTIAWNASGLPTSKTYADATAVTYAYDARGNLTNTTDSTGATGYAYDAQERLVRIGYPGGCWLQFAYDDSGRRTNSVNQLGHRLNYVYDAVGRLDCIINETDVAIVRYTYDAVGRLARKELGNGLYTTYAYDAAGQLLHLVNTHPDSTVISRCDYAYDSRGRRTACDGLNGAWTYGYDDLGQLTRAVFASRTNAIPSQDLTYVYDALGNRVRTVENGVETAYTVNNMNQYVSVGATNYVFDADGNLVREESAAGTKTYTYNDENRLVAVGDGNSTWEYVYDALGNRFSSTENGVTKRFVVDPIGFGNIVGEYGSGGGLVARYDHGLGLISRTEAAGSAAYYTFDAIGNALELVDGAGGVANAYRYSPFGSLISKSETILNPFQFVGQFGVMRERSGLEYMRARFYGDSFGRFLNDDPISFSDNLFNSRRYAFNNPVTFIDPSGKSVLLLLVRVGLNPRTWVAIYNVVDAIGTWYADGYSPITKLGEMTDKVKTLCGVWETGKDGWNDWISKQGSGEPNGSPGVTPDPLPDRTGLPTGYDVMPGNGGNFTGGSDPNPDYPKPPAPPVAPPTEKVDVPIWVPRDPNNLIGPAGYGPQNYLLTTDLLPYRINFENATNAVAPAQFVEVVNPLSTNFDLTTFELTGIGFGDRYYAIPVGSRHYVTTTAMSLDGVDFEVQIEAGIREATGEVYARFRSIDPLTGLPPPVDVGFLPPEDGTGRGQGHVSYLIKAKPGLPTGTEIRNVALITFDGEVAIATNQRDPHDPSQGTDPAKEALVTIDAAPPVSQMTVLPDTITEDGFMLSWSGEDEAGGSGIRSYTVYVSENGAAAVPWLTDTAETNAVFIGAIGHRYAFYVRATDWAGQPEASKAVAETATTVEMSSYLCDPSSDPALETAGGYDGYFYAESEFGGGAATAVRGTLNVKVSDAAAGKLTAKAVLQKGSLSFSAKAWTATEADGSFLAEMPGRGGEKLVLHVRQNRMWGTLAGGTVGETLAVDGARNRFADSKDAGAATLLGAFRGYYTVALPVYDGLSSGAAGAAPQGVGYLTVTVGNGGSAKIAGILADGTKLTQSSRLILFDGCGPEACVPVFAPLYAKTGWAGGLLWLTPDHGKVVTDRDRDWLVRWEKPGKGTDGFRLLLDVCGGWYNTVPALASAYLFSAGVGDVPYHYAGGSADWVAMPEDVGVSVAGGRMSIVKGVKPVKEGDGSYTYDGENVTGATLGFTAKTGLFKGKFSLFYDYDVAGRLTHKAVNVPYTGILTPVRDEVFKDLPVGMGSCLVPDNDSALKAYKIKRSFPVWLEAR